MNVFLLFVAILIFLFDVLFSTLRGMERKQTFIQSSYSMSYSRNITRIGTTLVFLCLTIFWLQNHVICFVRRRRNIRLTKEILEQWTLECGGALVELNCNVWMNIERDGIIRFSLKRGFILNKYTLTIFET